MKVPLKRTMQIVIAAVALDAALSTLLGKTPFAGTVVAAEYIPVAAITGQDTDTRKISIYNRGSAGLGTTVIASKQFNTAINAVAFKSKSLDLSGTPADLDFAAGDVLTIESDTLGTGLADPGGTVVLTIERNDS